MSEIHVKHLKAEIEKNYKGIIDLSDLKGNNPQLENFFLTRALAAYSIQHHAQVSPAVASDAVTDGSNDNGIDAIFYDLQTKTLYIVQSKWIHKGKGEPENGDVKKFISGISDLFDFNFNRFNSKLSSTHKCNNHII